MAAGPCAQFSREVALVVCSGWRTVCSPCLGRCACVWQEREEEAQRQNEAFDAAWGEQSDFASAGANIALVLRLEASQQQHQRPSFSRANTSPIHRVSIAPTAAQRRGHDHEWSS